LTGRRRKGRFCIL